MNIGDKLRSVREDKDLSQTDLARLIPMNQSNYSKIERGIQEPNLDQLKRICEILDISPSYLLGLNKGNCISKADYELLRNAKEFIKKHRNNL